MAMHENVKILSASVRITAGVAAAIVDRFVIRDTTALRGDEMITYVPGALGGVPDGILAMKPDTVRSDFSGVTTCGYVIPDGAEAVIELAENAGAGVWLRAGGNGAEVDGAGYLADATGDVRIFKTAEAGVVGQKVRGNFFGFSGTTP